MGEFLTFVGMFEFWGNHRHKKKDCEVTIIEETEIIIVEGQPYKKHNPHDIDTIERLVKIVDRLTKPKPVHLVLTENSNNTKSIIMSLSIVSNQFSLGTLELIDSNSLSHIDASFSNQSFSSSDDAIFTASQDGTDPSTVKASGVSAGEATLNYSATTTYTDANTGQSVTKDLSGTTPVTVTAVVTEQGVSLVVNFGEPQNQ